MVKTKEDEAAEDDDNQLGDAKAKTHDDNLDEDDAENKTLDDAA